MVCCQPSGDLIISGDCGGTNTRLSLWRIPKGAKEFKGATLSGLVHVVYVANLIDHCVMM